MLLLASSSKIPSFILPINAYFGYKAKQNIKYYMGLYFSTIFIIAYEDHINNKANEKDFILSIFYSLLSFLAGHKIS